MSTITYRLVKGAPLTLAEGDANFSNLNTDKVERDGTIPMTGKLTLVQPSTARASIRLVEGSSDPTSPAVGDVWNNGGAVKFRIADGTTVELLTSGGADKTFPNVEITGTLSVAENVVLNGTTLDINSTNVTITDKNLEIGSVASPSNATADGGGLTLKGTTDKTLTWINSTTNWTSSEHMDLASGKSYKINNTTVLSNTTLGAGVENSSLKTVGTLTSGTWNATAVGPQYGGTGLVSLPSNGQLLVGNGSGYTLATITGTTNRISVTNAEGSITLSTPQNLHTAATVQFGGIGVGTTPVANEIRAIGAITQNYVSDRKFKQDIVPVSDALALTEKIGGYTFNWTDAYLEDHGGADGFFNTRANLGVIAQEVQAVFPEAVVARPDGTLTVRYHYLIPVLIEAVKELSVRLRRVEEKTVLSGVFGR